MYMDDECIYVDAYMQGFRSFLLDTWTQLHKPLKAMELRLWNHVRGDFAVFDHWTLTPMTEEC